MRATFFLHFRLLLLTTAATTAAAAPCLYLSSGTACLYTDRVKQQAPWDWLPGWRNMYSRGPGIDQAVFAFRAAVHDRDRATAKSRPAA
jgi:hypothetical protein